MLVITQKSNAVKVYFDCFQIRTHPCRLANFAKDVLYILGERTGCMSKMPHAERPNRDSYVRLSVETLQIL
jgi:hypothetical protein